MPPVFSSPKFENINGRDVTFAVIYDLPWECYRAYAISLVRSGFSGIKLIVVDQTTRREVREGFTKLGFTVIERVTPNEKTGQWNETGWIRFYYAAEILKKNPEFRYAIWTDAKDVIFQLNPSTWLEKNLSPSQVAIEGLGHTINDCPSFNGPWVRALCPQEADWEQIKDFEVVCTGVIAGKAETMGNLMGTLCSRCYANTSPNTTDQGMINCLVRTPPYNELVRVPRARESFSTPDLGSPSFFTRPVEGIPILDENNILCNPETRTPVAIVHLYDRIPEWYELMRKRYTNGIEASLLIPGWMDPIELEWLALQASQHHTIAEIGSWRGRSTRALSENTTGIVYAVDTWKGSDEDWHKSELQGKSEDWLLEDFKKNMFGLSNFQIMQMTSLEAATKIPGQLDMVFIDASHVYEDVKADILAWGPLLKPGGLLCGHDYWWEGVKRAVDELVPKAKIVAGCIWSN